MAGGRRHTRRELMSAGSGIATAMAIAGCDLFATAPEGESGSPQQGTVSSSATEAPALTRLVRAGKLPKLDRRLPAEPLVVKPVERTGRYGGTWRNTTPDVPGDTFETIGYNPLVRWDREWTKVMPNIARSWDVADGGRAYTFRLRRGMKWSDGEPFTVDDILFCYQDVYQNSDLYPTFPDWLTAGGKPGAIDKVDDFTFTLTFAEPYAFLLEWLATPNGSQLVGLPKHYLRKFHKRYNDGADQLAKQEHFDSWVDLFSAKGGEGPQGAGYWQNADLPTLLPWVVKVPMVRTRLVVERNPYFWKVDADGRQLPYFDSVAIDVIPNIETAVLRVAQGAYSLPPSDLLTQQEKPLLARSRGKGKYHFVDWVTSTMNEAIIALNLNHKDPVKRRIFQNRDFRVGLSYAINRDEIIKAVYQGQGEPWQVAPRDDSPYYAEKLATQYLQYDVRRANQQLDRAGYDEHDSDGFRLGPDGRRLSFALSIELGLKKTWIDTGELLQGYFREVGVEMQVKSEASGLFGTRFDANSYDAILYDGNSGKKDALLDPSWYVPRAGSYFASRWGLWYETGGQAGEQPPAAVREQQRLYDRVRRTVDAGEQRRLYLRLLDMAADQFYAIGTLKPAKGYDIVHDNFHNVPSTVPEAWLYPDPGPLGPEQFFVTS